VVRIIPGSEWFY